MNKRQKEVEVAKLKAEEQELKHLKAIYNKAADDIANKLKISNGKINVLLKNYDELDEVQKSILQSQIYQRNFQLSLQKQIDGFLSDLKTDQYKSIDEYLKKCYETGFVGTMYDLHGQGIPLIMPIDQKQAAAAIKLDPKISKNLYTKLGEDVGLLKKRIANNVSRGIATASEYKVIARNIASASNMGFNRAMRIARTEGHGVQIQAAVDVQYKAKEKGADVLKQWSAALDGRTRDSHRRVDGEIRELDERFSNGMMYPSDSAGGAAEVVNCRCALLQRARWALDEDELQTLKDRATYYGLDKTKNFEDFQQKYLKAAEAEKVIENSGRSGTIYGIKDYDELSEYLKDVHNVEINNSVRNLDFESVKEGLIGIEKVLDEFPQAKPYLARISTKKSGIMCAEYDGTINFNPAYYKDRKSAVHASESTGFHPKGNNVISTGSHEMGHILELAMINKNGGGVFGAVWWSDCTYAKAIVKDAQKAAKKTAEGKGKRNAELVSQISGYAKKDASECLAEAVADYILNGENAAILSKEIWKILKGELG